MAADCGHADLQQQLVGYLRTQWNPDSGGFRARDDGSEEIMTTSMAGLACLAAGETEPAEGAACWLERIWETQPDIQKGLYHVWRPNEGLIRGDGSAAYVVDASQPRQWYFQYGISAAFLAEYCRITGDGAALELARRYLAASAHCAADVYRTPQSGKIGWGAAWTYRLGGDPQYADLADVVVGWLSAVQCGDGSWNGEGVYETSPSTAEPARFDVTAEFVALLAQMGATARV